MKIVMFAAKLKPMQAKFGGRGQSPGAARHKNWRHREQRALGREARGEEVKILPPALHTLSVQGGGEPVPT